MTLGPEARGYYPVIKGLVEGDRVVTAGNFLIDSESRLKGALDALGLNGTERLDIVLMQKTLGAGDTTPPESAA